MKNKKIINKDNLIYNLNKCKKIFPNICAMVKANAYGHGDVKIVEALKKHINFFGVASAKEALALRKKFDDINILVVGKTRDYKRLIKNNISFTIDSILELNAIEKICKQVNTKAKIHIAINTGMNRIGIKDITEYEQILNTISQNKFLVLQGIFTHVFDADKKENHFYEQMNVFYKYVQQIKDKNILIHIGGSFVLKHKIPSFVNMVRIGYFLYGYGMRGLKPVMQIESKIIKIIDCKSDEYVGYGNNKLKQNTKVAIVPMGYADGLHRRLSNKYYVYIKDGKCKIIGNICMDMFMVDITNVECTVGDKVLVMKNALAIADIVQTSPYEVLTSFNQLR